MKLLILLLVNIKFQKVGVIPRRVKGWTTQMKIWFLSPVPIRRRLKIRASLPLLLVVFIIVLLMRRLIWRSGWQTFILIMVVTRRGQLLIRLILTSRNLQKKCRPSTPVRVVGRRWRRFITPVLVVFGRVIPLFNRGLRRLTVTVRLKIRLLIVLLLLRSRRIVRIGPSLTARRPCWVTVVILPLERRKCISLVVTWFRWGRRQWWGQSLTW